MPVASQFFCICKSVNVMSALCSLNIALSFSGARMNLDGSPVNETLREKLLNALL